MKIKLKTLIRRIILLTFVGGIIFLAVIFATLPDIEEYTYRPAAKSDIISSDGVLIGQICSQNSTYTAKEDIPQQLYDAVVAIEDKRFYRHCGIDIIGIGRALVENIKAGEIVQGGSTITQQVAKMQFFSTKQSYIRKLREAITAMRLTAKYTDKRDILCIYLNEIYLGGGAYGVYAASQTYFDKEPKELTLSECALIAGIIQAPSAYCPLGDGLHYALERKDKVLTLMAEQGYISEQNAKDAKAKEITLNPSDESTFAYGTCLSGYESYLNRLYEQCLDTIASYYVRNMKHSEQQAEAEASEILSGGELVINASINSAMQENALSAMRSVLSGKDDAADCSFIFTDTESGKVRMYYGSDENIDMNKHPRQPGSTIKPLYMAYLIENDLADRNTIVDDARFEINGYSPQNNGGEYYGTVTLRETLVHSLNAASLRLFMLADTHPLVDYVASLGVTTLTEDDYTAAFALGGLSEGIKPSELVLAYGAIENGGYLYNIGYLESIESKDGVIVFPEEAAPKKVMSSRTSSELSSCLCSAVLRGTGKTAATGYLDIGKTGTTDNSRDVWFCGATGNLAAAIWIGNVDYDPVSGISSSWCSQIYKKTLLAAISEGDIPASALAPAPSEQMIELTVASSDYSGKAYLTAEEVAAIAVPDYEKPAFAGREVVECAVDVRTGRLFNDKVCDPAERALRYYPADSAPTALCRRIYHFIYDLRGE